MFKICPPLLVLFLNMYSDSKFKNWISNPIKKFANHLLTEDKKKMTVFLHLPELGIGKHLWLAVQFI